MNRLLLLAFALFLSCSESRVQYGLQGMDTTVITDPVMDDRIAPYRDSLSTIMGRVLVTSTAPIVRDRPDSPLGSLIADLILQEAKAELKADDPMPDLCLLNIGGLRIDLPQGDIDLNRAFELMPFENSICMVRLSPQGMRSMLTYIIKVGGQPTSGMLLHVKDSAETSCSINGKPLEERSYWVVTSDYLADGGDKMTFFTENEGRIDLDLKIRDAIIRHFEQRGVKELTIAPVSDRRIIIAP